MSERYTSELRRELLSSLEPVHAPEGLWAQVEAALEPRSSRWPPRWSMAASLLLVVGGGAWYLHPAATAMDVHEELAHHPERLDIRTSNPSEVRGWIASNTAMVAALASRPQPDPDGLEMVGARVLHDGRAAIAYRIDGYPATLLMARASGRSLPIKQIVCRPEPRAGVNVFSWQVLGQVYSLVSSASVDGRRACFICHVEPARRQIILRMKFAG